jgi:hypothetical protein
MRFAYPEKALLHIGHRPMIGERQRLQTGVS